MVVDLSSFCRLHISDTTIKTHLSNVFSKLTLRDRVQAVVYAYETASSVFSRAREAVEHSPLVTIRCT